MDKRLGVFLLVTIILAVIVSPFASGLPDGLERVAIDLGVMENEAEPLFEVIPDYSLTFIENEWISTSLSGLIGLLICLGAVYLAWKTVHVLKGKKKIQSGT